MALRRIGIEGYFGDRKFWDVIDAVTHEQSVSKIPWKTDAQWRRIFAVAEKCALPKFVWLGLLRQRRLCQESQALGLSAEQRHNDEVAAAREHREQAASQQTRPISGRSSRGRTRVAVAERDEL